MVIEGSRRLEFFGPDLQLRRVLGQTPIIAGSVEFESIFRGMAVTPNVIDFLQKCLTWNPNERITADAALSHPFLDSMKTYKRLSLPDLPQEKL
jgi:serine/threonine protein kinase